MESVIHVYTPFVVWTGLGLLTQRWLPELFPHLLGRALYWVGVPLQIFALVRHTDFDGLVWVVPLLALAVLGLNLTLMWLGLGWWPEKLTVAQQGSLVLAGTLVNTGFVGLGIAPGLVDAQAWDWVVSYSLTNNLLGTYGIGILVASYFGAQQTATGYDWKKVLLTPTLWAFALSYFCRPLPFPTWLETALDQSVPLVIDAAFVLTGWRLCQVGWNGCWRLAAWPTLMRIAVMPLLVGLGLTVLQVQDGERLAVVLMAGMPTAMATLIFAEEYELDRDILAATIALTTVGILLLVPLWLWWFG
ncbi:MAG: AEC family transporter [Gloeomargarita sp. SKYBB_i_bin120]|nr:AEC family transporter [Gloeomargarita sp. SKYG98]MCS7291407.1 AEC family transporter [Gloeomargarita sp. SKYB120]MDW8176967.1 AEC family transporter [Gloeomargarita sp. SKYBB_i_bin120]